MIFHKELWFLWNRIKSPEITNNSNKGDFIMNLKEKILIKRFIWEILGTILGAFIIAVAVSLFLLPNKLSSGGVAGLATITYYLFHMSMGISMLIINVPLFLMSILKIGKIFFVKSVIGTIALSVFIDILDKTIPLTEDKFLACIYGGILMGVGTAIILKSNSSTGGTDLFSYIAKVYKPTLKVGEIIFLIDIAIVILNMFFLKEIEIGLYSAIAIYLMGKIIDILFEGIYFTKLIYIVSEKAEEIAKEIGSTIGRGTTGIYGKGMYTNSDKLILMCAVTRKDLGNTIQIIRRIDKRSFVIITNSREVLGLGFKA